MGDLRHLVLAAIEDPIKLHKSVSASWPSQNEHTGTDKLRSERTTRWDRSSNTEQAPNLQSEQPPKIGDPTAQIGALCSRDLNLHQSQQNGTEHNITERNSTLLFLPFLHHHLGRPRNPCTELRERVEPGRIHGDGTARYLSLLLLFFSLRPRLPSGGRHLLSSSATRGRKPA
jgi:hypothetical protein